MSTNTKNNKKQGSQAIHNGLNKREKALVFSSNEEIRKRFTRFVYECFEFSAYAIHDKDLLKSELYWAPYRTILLDVDSIFYELIEILRYIQDKRSKNKESKIYLITSSKENSSKLRKIKLHKRIILLMDGEEIVYLIGGKKMPPLENSLNSSTEEKQQCQ